MKGRFAPSPTGHIHMGNIWIAMLSYVSTRLQGGSFLLRMEDIDRQRSRRELGEALLDDLEWLGFDWEQGPRVSQDGDAYWQSNRTDYYNEVLRTWEQEHLLYPCFCNRARIQKIASAPHVGDHLPLYDGHCRHLSQSDCQSLSQVKNPSYRLRLSDIHLSFQDIWQGSQESHLFAGTDDFVLKRADGMFAYNLAVVLDDVAMGVTEVIRGADLLATTGHQIYLYELLGKEHPTYGHAPLLLDGDGHRLSKRQESITVKELRDAGYSPSSIWKHLVEGTGLYRAKEDLSLHGLVDLWAAGALHLDVLKQKDIVLSLPAMRSGIER